MSLAVAIQMDAPERLDIDFDTSLVLAAEAMRRGHDVRWYDPLTLALSGGRLMARLFPMVAKEGCARQLSAPGQWSDLGEQDIVLIRQDPPFDTAYLTTTHLLEHIQPDVLVVNDPAGIRNAPEKLLPLYFPDITPPTLITADREAIEAFRAEYGDLVLKPLYGAGGGGVLFLSRTDPNLKVLMQLEAQGGAGPLVVQPFLTGIETGDKRVIVVEGEPVGAVLRRPVSGEIRSNLHAGGMKLPSTVTDRDREICMRIGSALREMGLVLAGLDIIGGWLIEINVTSPGMIPELRELCGIDAAKPFWDAVEARFESWP